MKWLNLQLIKAQLRMEQDFTEEDELLTLYGESAEQTILDQTRRTDAELVEMGGGEFPPTLKHAILLLGAHLYNQRESVSSVQLHAVPDALQSLIKPYRRLVSDDSRKNEA